MKKLVAALGLVWTVGGLLAAPRPLWELPAAKRGMELSRATAFDVPQAVAIPDHTAFTVELELGLDKPPTVFYQPLPLLDEEIGGTGFALCLRSYQPQGAAVSLGLFMRLNGLNYEVRLSPLDAGEPLKLRVKFRKGFVVVSECRGEKWQMLKSYLRIVSPNERPIRVGDAKSYPPDASRPDLRGARLKALRFWGSDYEVFAPNEDRKPAAGVLSGEGFTMDVPVEEREERKRLLYVGDSISGGYGRFLVQLLGDRAYPYHWWSFWGGAKPPVVSPDALKKPLSYRAYDMIVFNNGLHSLNWDEATATDGEIRAHYASLVEAFRANCPKARLVYMNTTPWGRLKGPQGGYVTGGRKNDVVRRLNRIAGEVMREKKVEVLDAYALMSANLQYLYGDDDCHYRDEGYRLIARMIADCFEASATSLRLPDVIADHMMLQRGVATRVWGEGKPGCAVTVRIGSASGSAVTESNGWWCARLDTTRLGAEPLEMTVEGGGDCVTVKDVVVGDVWLASGQSNMEFQMNGYLKELDNPFGEVLGAQELYRRLPGRDIRFFRSKFSWDRARQEGQLEGRWFKVTPETAGTCSATALSFIEKVQGEIGGPMAVIDISIGGTSVWQWMGHEDYAKWPALQRQWTDENEADRRAAYYEDWRRKNGAVFPNCDMRDLLDGTDGWHRSSAPGTSTTALPHGCVIYRSRVRLPEDWRRTLASDARFRFACDAFAATNVVCFMACKEGVWPNASGHFKPLREISGAVPLSRLRYADGVLTLLVCQDVIFDGARLAITGLSLRRDDTGAVISLADALWESKTIKAYPACDRAMPLPIGFNTSHVKMEHHYNRQFHPMRRLSAKGIIWYQGCNDAYLKNYSDYFADMIRIWRRDMGVSAEELPFLYCQLAGFGAFPTSPGEVAPLASVRMEQAATLGKVKNVGMAVILETGEVEVHGRNKIPAGQRLARLALNRVYGRRDVVCDSPLYRRWWPEGDAAYVQFTTPVPLKAAEVPATYSVNAYKQPAPYVRLSPGSQLEGFSVRDAKGVWHWADAEVVSHDTVKVTAKGVDGISAVHYNTGKMGYGNLVNEAGLYASCFITEERPTTTAEFEIRDPFILREGGTYYCYFSKSWFGGREVKVRTSTDLENWSEAKVVLRVKEEWRVSAVWAPEVHRFNGRYYLFATLHCNDGKHRKTGTWVFAADRPEGPFEPTKDDALTPEGTSIDGTPVADSDGTPWMVYCSAVAGRDCSMMAVRLNADFSGTEGEPVALFDWKALRGHLKKSGVSEGASLYRSKGGRLFMTWSNVSCWGYCVALAVSDSGRVTGPWRQLGIPIRIDGGHGAFFTRTDGSLAFALHAPNSSGSFERMVFADVEDRGEALDFRLRLPIVDRWCGGTREIFDFHGLTAWVVTPDRVAPGRPWTWSLHWNGAFYDRTGAQDLVRQGYLHAAFDVADLDDERALAELAAFQDHLVGTRGFAPQANLIGMDRGAALAQAYAAAHPSSVRAMFLDDGQTATFVRDGREKKVVLGERPYPGLDGKDMHLLMETFK